MQIAQKLVDEGYVSKKKHRYADLWIYNYTQKAQFEGRTGLWEQYPELLQCRGLILDGAGNIVARPFKKFFNFEEYPDGVPSFESFVVFEKYDGSLIIVTTYKNKRIVATRGSFESEQVFMAEDILEKTYSYITGFPEEKTYLFELLHRNNRIVVNYGDTKDLVLIGIVDNKTGENLELEELGFPIVEKYDKNVIKGYQLNK